jgi:hypothetical protein
VTDGSQQAFFAECFGGWIGSGLCMEFLSQASVIRARPLSPSTGPSEQERGAVKKFDGLV